jgi:hypothetical protein
MENKGGAMDACLDVARNMATARELLANSNPEEERGQLLREFRALVRLSLNRSSSPPDT